MPLEKQLKQDQADVSKQTQRTVIPQLILPRNCLKLVGDETPHQKVLLTQFCGWPADPFPRLVTPAGCLLRASRSATGSGDALRRPLVETPSPNWLPAVSNRPISRARRLRVGSDDNLDFCRSRSHASTECPAHADAFNSWEPPACVLL